MKLLILSRGLWIHATSRLFREGRARGHQVRVLDPHGALGGVGPGVPTLAFRDRAPPRHDGVLPRISQDQQPAGLALLQALEAAGLPVQNPAAAIQLASDKFATLARLAGAGLPVPATVTARRGDHLARHLYEGLGAGPLVVKSRHGTQGGAVLMAPEPRAAAALVQALGDSGVPAMVQEFVAEAAGEDHRLFVVGGEVRGAITRRAPPGDFRSNLHRGGTCLPLEPAGELCQLAVRAASLIGLGVAGVDVLLSHRGPLILEVNASPGLQGVEAASGCNLAGAMVEHLEQLIDAGGPADPAPHTTVAPPLS